MVRKQKSSFRAAALAIAVLLMAAADKPRPGRLTDEERATVGTLFIGDPAPPLSVSQWIKGAPVSRFEPGRVYVLDFWASWCGPCIAVMQRVSQLQDKFADRLTVIAVTSEDKNNTVDDIRRCVEKNDQRIRFRVAIDRDTQMADAYRRAAREPGIPRSFVIDQKGRLAWIGHPSEAEPVVAQIVVGTWNLEEAARTQKDGASKKVTAFRTKELLFAAQKAGDKKEELVRWEQLCAVGPNFVAYSPKHWPWKARIALLIELNRGRDARTTADETLRLPEFAQDPWAHADVAESLIPEDLEKAGHLADRAASLIKERERGGSPADEWDAWMWSGNRDIHARAYVALAQVRHAQGRSRAAAEMQRQAIQRLDPEEDASYLKELRETLATYEARAGGTE